MSDAEPRVRSMVFATDARAWNAYVESHPCATVCHLAEWHQIVERVYGWRAHYLALEDSARLRGVLPLIEISRPFGPKRLVSLPYLDRGGPLADSVGEERLLLEAAVALVGRLDATDVEVRDYAARDGGAEPVTHRFRFLLGLPAAPEQLWEALPDKVRNQVRKSQKVGLVTRSEPAEALPEFYRVYATTMRDLGSPAHAKRFFEAIMMELRDRTRLFLTRDRSGAVVAGALALRFRDEVTVPWAASLHARLSECPNHSLYWEVLSDSIARGATTFDYGRSWNDSGQFRFKRQWGAEPVPLHWSSVGPSGLLSPSDVLAPPEAPLVQAIWRKLPLPVASFVGPVIRRYLAN
jgi:FemAB-related protein (PEP-CTERM system-associated)